MTDAANFDMKTYMAYNDVKVKGGSSTSGSARSDFDTMINKSYQSVEAENCQLTSKPTILEPNNAGPTTWSKASKRCTPPPEMTIDPTLWPTVKSSVNLPRKSKSPVKSSNGKGVEFLIKEMPRLKGDVGKGKAEGARRSPMNEVSSNALNTKKSTPMLSILDVSASPIPGSAKMPTRRSPSVEYIDKVHKRDPWVMNNTFVAVTYNHIDDINSASEVMPFRPSTENDNEPPISRHAVTSSPDFGQSKHGRNVSHVSIKSQMLENLLRQNESPRSSERLTYGIYPPVHFPPRRQQSMSSENASMNGFNSSDYTQSNTSVGLMTQSTIDVDNNHVNGNQYGSAYTHTASPLLIDDESAYAPGQQSSLPCRTYAIQMPQPGVQNVAMPMSIMDPAAAAFRPGMTITGVSPNYRGNPCLKANQSAEIPEHESTALWVTNLPPECNDNMLLSSATGTGKVFATVINPPDFTLGHLTSAAKIVFFDTAGAQALLQKARMGQFVVNGYIPKVNMNRIRTPAHSAGPESRVIHIEGPKLIVNVQFLHHWFSQRFTYSIDAVFLLHEDVSPIGRRRLEWRFGSYRCQAASALSFIDKERKRNCDTLGCDASGRLHNALWRQVNTFYGVDPCA
ncbi:hypothetical protein BJ170DRAFT_727306 [Xylariales sp. AK1849]|nr:hypothetical protein BJ170DRAFT_727306 [Xylariales sp. AK1849]